MAQLLRTTFALTIALVGCGGGGTTDPGGDPGGLPNFAAKINNVAWSPTVAVTAINPTPGLYSITGFRFTGTDQYSMIFALYNIKGPGTYTLGVGPGMFGGTALLSLAPSSGWATPLDGVAGELVITTLTATRLVATFHFTAEPQSGSTGTKTVTQGVMDIPVSGTGGVALENQGHRVTGTIGEAFNASVGTSILSNAGGANPVLTITASNGTRNVTISLANMTGPATYPLSPNTPIRSIGVGGAPGNFLVAWNSQTAGGNGTVTITSMTATRIVGSFSATVTAAGGGAVGNLAISGTFDMGRL